MYSVNLFNLSLTEELSSLLTIKEVGRTFGVWTIFCVADLKRSKTFCVSLIKIKKSWMALSNRLSLSKIAIEEHN